jgi:hypothetical protein
MKSKIILLTALLLLSAGTAYAASSASLVITKNHSLYDVSADIVVLQQFLNAHSFTVAQSGAGSPGHETNYFGLLTFKALKNFQLSQEVPNTGYLGPLTRAALAAFTSSLSTSSATPAPGASGQTTATTTTFCLQTYCPGNGYIPGFGAGGTVSGGGGSAPVSDTTAPSVSVTAPANSATVGGTTVTVSANASDNVAVAGVQFKLDTNTFVGTEDTSAPYSVTWDSTGASDGSHTLIAVARDTSGNYATSSAIAVTVDNTAPVNSSIAATPRYNTATVTWTTNEAATSKVSYGTSSGTYTQSALSGTLVTSHSVGITQITDATLYYYVVVSTDALGNTATSSERTFTTHTIASFGLDGSAHINNSSSVATQNITLSTTNADDVVVLAGTINSTSISSITDSAGLTWLRRTTTGGGGPLELWYSTAPNALTSDVITIHYAGTATFATIDTFGVSGADTSVVWGGGNLPYTSTASPADPLSYTVNETNTFTIAAFRFGTHSTPTQGPGWSAVSGADYQLTEYKIASSSQAGATATVGTGNADSNAGIADAIVQYVPSPPSLAEAWGYTKETFSDNFSSLSTFDTSNSLAAGKNWYLKNQWTANTNMGVGWTAPANTNPSDISVSSNGLTLANGADGGIVGLNTAAQTSGSSYVGTTFSGGFYVRAIFSTDRSFATANPSSWPIIWAIPVEPLINSTNTFDEQDLIEIYGTGAGTTEESANQHEWDVDPLVNTNNQITGQGIYGSNIDANYHTLERLWIPPSLNGGTGIIRTYIDGVLVANVTYSGTTGSTPAGTPSNPNGLFTASDAQNWFFKISTGVNWPFNVRSFEVWQR